MIRADDPAFGFNSGQFSFPVIGTPCPSLVIEASPDLLQWTPLATNDFRSGSLYFTDPQSTAWPSRFYRARTQ